MNLIASMTAYRRPGCTRQVLEAFHRCEGWEEVPLLIQCEPGNAEVEKMVKEASPWARINPQRLGLNKNSHAALTRAACWDGADAVLHIEDDTVLSPDALLYYRWALEQVRDRRDIFSVSGYNRADEEPARDAFGQTGERKWFTCWGWACTLERLKEMLDRWSFSRPKSFATHLNKKVRGSRLELYPLLSRVQNIGYTRCTSNHSESWYRKHHRCKWVAEDVGEAPWRTSDTNGILS